MHHKKGRKNGTGRRKVGSKVRRARRNRKSRK